MQQLVVLCTPDGIVDMTPQAIAARTSIPLEIITKGLAILSDPDPHSRTPGDDGRRIVLMDGHRPWGWLIVNHNKYRHMKDADTVRAQTRERVRKHREKQAGTNDVTPVTRVTRRNDSKRHTDSDSHTDSTTDTGKSKPYAPQASLSDVDPQVVADWLAVRKRKKAAVTETAISGIRIEAGKAGLSMEAVLRLCCERGWASFDSTWDRSGNGRGAGLNKQEALEARNRAAVAQALREARK